MLSPPRDMYVINLTFTLYRGGGGGGGGVCVWGVSIKALLVWY